MSGHRPVGDLGPLADVDHVRDAVLALTRLRLGRRLADGAHIDADLVVVGVGIIPNTELAEAAGLTVDNGIKVDEHLRSPDPDIYAAGDVANAFHPLLDKHIRVEHWANALNQPATAAQAMLGRDAGYDKVPYFFSDQYDLGMEYSGYVEPGEYDEVVVRGDVGQREFLALWVKDRTVLAGMNVNIWDVTGAIKSLVSSRRLVDTAKLADVDVPLTEVYLDALDQTQPMGTTRHSETSRCSRTASDEGLLKQPSPCDDLALMPR